LSAPLYVHGHELHDAWLLNDFSFTAPWYVSNFLYLQNLYNHAQCSVIWECVFEPFALFIPYSTTNFTAKFNVCSWGRSVMPDMQRYLTLIASRYSLVKTKF
jgi:hypothetical protein